MTRALGRLVFVALAGCAGKAGPVEAEATAPVVRPALEYCAAIYDKAYACASPREKLKIAEIRDEVMAACRGREERDTLEEKAELACATRPTCEEYEACQQELDAAEATRELEAALAGGEGLADAAVTCKLGGATDERTKRLCGQVLARAVEQQTREVTAIRDRGGDGLKACVELQAIAGEISAEERARAELLCKETEASRRASEALAEARTFLDAGKLELPFQCGMAIEDLEPLATEWARARLREVVQGCHVELGKRILPARVPKMVICEYHVEQVYDAVVRLAVADAALEPWIARAAKKCKK